MQCGGYVIHNVPCSNVGNCEALMKFVLLCNVMCNFVTTMKICQDDIHKLYVNPISTFNNLFCSFHGLTTITHEEMCMKWFIVPNLGINHLAFEFIS
jgi:hypothetical protein